MSRRGPERPDCRSRCSRRTATRWYCSRVRCSWRSRRGRGLDTPAPIPDGSLREPGQPEQRRVDGSVGATCLDLRSVHARGMTFGGVSAMPMPLLVPIDRSKTRRWIGCWPCFGTTRCLTTEPPGLRHRSVCGELVRTLGQRTPVAVFRADRYRLSTVHHRHRLRTDLKPGGSCRQVSDVVLRPRVIPCASS